MTILDAQPDKMYYMPELELLVFVCSTEYDTRVFGAVSGYSSHDGTRWSRHEFDKPYVVEPREIYDSVRHVPHRHTSTSWMGSGGST